MSKKPPRDLYPTLAGGGGRAHVAYGVRMWGVGAAPRRALGDIMSGRDNCIRFVEALGLGISRHALPLRAGPKDFSARVWGEFPMLRTLFFEVILE
jgi:hypothetical protein